MKDQVVVITGASSGIGAALAHHLGGMGAKLVLAARRADRLEAIAAEYAGAIAVPTDVTDSAACERLIQRTIEAHGRLDVLVNNAGITMQAAFEDVTDLSVFHKLMNVNYFGAVYCTHYALPYLKASRGMLLGVSSLLGKVGGPYRSGYAASKAAMERFYDSLRMELMGSGVAVGIVSPNFVESEIHSHMLGADGQANMQRQFKIRYTADECAEIIVDAIQHRKRDVIAGTTLEQLAPLIKFIAPGYVDQVARKQMQPKE